MGAAMAGNLLKAGYTVRVWNRTPAKAAELVAQGAELCTSPAEAARDVAAAITIVADDSALRGVSLGETGLLAAMPAGSVHLSMGTVSTQITTELAQAHAAAGSLLLSAPVFGSKESALGAKLWGIAAGPKSAFERTRPIIEAMTQSVRYLGEDPASAAAMKILVNSLISAASACMAQAFIAGSRIGLSAPEIMDVIRLVFNSPPYERYGGRMAERDFAVHFPLKLMLKDIQLMLDLGASTGVPMPHAAATREMLVAAIGQGFGDADAVAGLLQGWERTAGS